MRILIKDDCGDLTLLLVSCVEYVPHMRIMYVTDILGNDYYIESIDKQSYEAICALLLDNGCCDMSGDIIKVCEEDEEE